MTKQQEREIEGYPCPECSGGMVKRRLFKSGPNPIYVTKCSICYYHPEYDDSLDEDKEVDRFKQMINNTLNFKGFTFTLDQLKRINKILNE